MLRGASGNDGGNQSSNRTFDRFYNHSSKPTGLQNVGFNSYMNAALQALSGSSKFVDEIKSLADENEELRKLSLFSNLLNSLNDTSQLTINAANNGLFENWSKSGEQDAFEVMSFMFNEVINECKGKHKLNQVELSKINFPMVLKLSYKIECELNHGTKTPIQTDLALHVPIPEKRKNITITDVLNEVVEGESISEYSCDTEGCRSKTGKKYIKLIEVPNILCIHIQRNQLTAWGGMTKNYSKITLESDTLELSRHLFLNNNCICTYQLCSVIDHKGDLTGGHYKCYKRFKNRWYCANDSNVRELQFINDCDVHVLIYELVKKEMIISVNDETKRTLDSINRKMRDMSSMKQKMDDIHYLVEKLRVRSTSFNPSDDLNGIRIIIKKIEEIFGRTKIQNVKEVSDVCDEMIKMIEEGLVGNQVDIERMIGKWEENVDDFGDDKVVDEIKVKLNEVKLKNEEKMNIGVNDKMEELIKNVIDKLGEICELTITLIQIRKIFGVCEDLVQSVLDN